MHRQTANSQYRYKTFIYLSRPTSPADSDKGSSYM